MLFFWAGDRWIPADLEEVRFLREDAQGLFLPLFGGRVAAKIVAPD